MLEMTSQTAPAGRRSAPASLSYNLAGIAVLALLLAVGAAYFVDELGRASRVPVPSIDDGDTITQTLSGRELTIPASWLRYGDQIRDGFTSQIDLRINFAPADAATSSPVDITLLPRSRVRTSASLLDRVYLHQFGEQTLSGVSGLVGKPMMASNGYGGESVWYDALSPNPFVAKCVEPISAGGTSQCIRTVYLPSGIAAVYTFDAVILQQWRDFDAEVQRWLDPIGAW